MHSSPYSDVNLLKSEAETVLRAKFKSTLPIFEFNARNTCGSAPFPWWGSIEGDAALYADPANPRIVPGMDHGVDRAFVQFGLSIFASAEWWYFVKLIFALDGTAPLPNSPPPQVSYNYNTRSGGAQAGGQAQQIPSGTIDESHWSFVIPAPDGTVTQPDGSAIIPSFSFAPQYVGGALARDVLKTCAILPFTL